MGKDLKVSLVCDVLCFSHPSMSVSLYALYPNSIHTNQSNSADTTMQFFRISLISVYYSYAN